MNKQMRYSPEVRERAVRLMYESKEGYGSVGNDGIESTQDWLRAGNSAYLGVSVSDMCCQIWSPPY